jgi:uncharacterized protein (DUF1778 family)
MGRPQKRRNDRPRTVVRRRQGSARLEARISAEQKRLFQRAAAVRGVTLTNFVLTSAHEAATRAVQEDELLSLATHERQRFIDALLKPPAPNAALRRAARRYRALLGQ